MKPVIRLLQEAAGVAVVVFASSVALADGLSGAWVAKGPGWAVLLEIVQTNGGGLTGRYAQVALQSNGNLARMEGMVAGVTDGHTIVVAIRPMGLLSDPISASGTISGSTLHLAGGSSSGNISLDFLRSSDAEFAAGVAQLNAQGQAISTANADAKTQTEVEKLTKEMAAFSTRAAAGLARAGTIESRYREITNWMDAALVRERSIFGGGQAGVARSQIAVSINQAELQAIQIHVAMDASRQEFTAHIEAIQGAMPKIAAYCQQKLIQPVDDSASPCASLSKEMERFAATASRWEEAFAQVERVWVEENAKQQRIIQIASSF